MQEISKEDQKTVDGLMKEIGLLKRLIASEQYEVVREELKQEMMLLVVQVNTIYGTDHIMEGSKISVIN